MRLLLIFLIAIPFFSTAQIDRSATELAQERIREYISTKIFNGLPYKPISYGKLKPQKQPRSEVAWSITHQFEIIDSQFVADKKTVVQKPYYFSFYLDKKLKIVTAQSYYME
jgi:hypothetical protein